MAGLSESVGKIFLCNCQKHPLTKYQIINHLKKKVTHNISKIVPTQSPKDIKYLILNRITNIAKTQIKVQCFSNQLIQAITQNTSLMIQKLSNIINLYKHLILNIPKVNDIKKLEVINTFKFKNTLFNELTQHFGQQPLAYIHAKGTIIRNTKTQVIDIRRNHQGHMNCMEVFSDEKRVVTGGFDGAIRVWNLETNFQIWFILKHKDKVKSLALANTEDLLLTGSNDKSVRLWDVKLKIQIHKFIGHTLGVSSVLFSQDQSTGFSGSADKTIRSWNLKLLTPQRTIPFQMFIQKIYLIREEKIIVASTYNGFVSLFNLKDSQYSNTSSRHNITSICFTANEEHFISGSFDGTVEIWLTNGLMRHSFQKKHSAEITSIQISICSKLFATGSVDKTVIIWDSMNLCTIRTIENSSAVIGLYFVKNSSSLLILQGNSIDWCSLITFVKQEKIKTKLLNSIAISSDLKYAAYGFFCVSLIDIQNNKKVSKSFKIKNVVICLKFSPDSALVSAGGGEGEITILTIPNLVQLRTLITKLSSVKCLSFSKSNELIGFGCGKSVKVMSIESKEKFYENEGKEVTSVCFCSNDEKFIYSDGARICVLNKNFRILTLICFGNKVIKLFVNEDDSYVLVSHLKNKLSILKTESLKKIFEDESKKVVKDWCYRKQEINFRTLLSLSYN